MAERRSFPIGSRVKVKATIRDESGTLVDPGDVVFQIRTPDGVDTVLTYLTSQVVRVSTGVYYAWVSLEQAPRYHIRISCTGSYQATTGDFVIPVDPSQFPRVDSWVTAP